MPKGIEKRVPNQRCVKVMPPLKIQKLILLGKIRM
jgi:hypothetical protein